MSRTGPTLSLVPVGTRRSGCTYSAEITEILIDVEPSPGLYWDFSALH